MLFDWIIYFSPKTTSKSLTGTPNAAELAYVVSGEVIISVLDPIRYQLLTYQVTSDQVVFIPENWWHWVTAISDQVHVVLLYRNEKRQIIQGSDVLRKTPPNVANRKKLWQGQRTITNGSIEVTIIG